MFLFKKAIGPFFDPLSVCLAILAAGLIVLLFTKRQKLGKIFMGAGFILLVVFSYNWVPGLFIKPLESKYPALVNANKASGAKWIVVLGNGVADEPGLPANSRLYNGSLVRLIEGLRIHKALPGTKLILSGGLGPKNATEADAMARTAMSLGIDRRKLVLDSGSRDTEDQARMIKRVVGSDPFILVTSASHMPRAVALTKKLGLKPIPSPADYKVRKDTEPLGPAGFFPNSTNIMKMELAMHEYLGMAWARMSGRF
jgi:uncharacterized SAM-binding protein YcdF (DUF218 family)